MYNTNYMLYYNKIVCAVSTLYYYSKKKKERKTHFLKSISDLNLHHQTIFAMFLSIMLYIYYILRYITHIYTKHKTKISFII